MWRESGSSVVCRSRVRGLCCQGRIALQLPACQPTAQAPELFSQPEPLHRAMQHLVFSRHPPASYSNKGSVSAGVWGSVTLSAVPSLPGEGLGKTRATTAGTSITYRRRSNLLLKDRKDSGKSVISGISYGKLGSSG